MSQAKGWIGVDLDGTLAHYDGWHGCFHIGKPIMTMVALVQKMLEDGKDVRIFTARVCDKENERLIRDTIENWCKNCIGKVLPITNVKDYSMIMLYDDRCISVECNTGKCKGWDR